MNNLAKEFPDFDNTELFQAILNELSNDGFIDGSYHNDELPCICRLDADDEKLVTIWINYKADPIADGNGVFNEIELSFYTSAHKGFSASELDQLYAEIKSYVPIYQSIKEELSQ